MIIFSLHLSQRLFLDFSLFHWRKDVVILFLAETTLLNLVSIIYWFVSSSFVESESYSLSGNRRRRRAEGKTPFFTGNRGEGPEATAALLVTCQISSRCVCAEWEMAAAAAGGGGKGGGWWERFKWWADCSKVPDCRYEVIALPYSLWKAARPLTHVN